MFRTLLALVRPFASIAKSLRALVELYEMELQNRDNRFPIYRVTEKPKKTDTEISYSGVDDTRPLHKRWFAAENEPEEDV